METMVFTILLVCSWAAAGSACSCGRHRDADYCREDLVFLGTVVNEELREASEENTIESDGPWFFESGYYLYTVQIDEIFWAQQDVSGIATLNLTTPKDDGLCGIQFVLNTSYLFSVSVDVEVYVTDLCSENIHWGRVTSTRKQFFSNDLRPLCEQRG